jgi:hydroxyacylglutathione hydrolase
MVGNIRIDVLHTPGHTPEHLSFVVTDTAGATAPMGIVTGDFVFVGDVGRPDLLEKAAKVAGSADGAARALWNSLSKFRALPDHLQVWPGHGAGSACGKGMSAVPQSTVGYEKLFNWAFGAGSEGEFVAQVLADQPEPPKYFAEMKRLNRDGPPILGGFRRPPKLDAARLPELLAAGAMVVDARPGEAFTARHVPGTIHIPLGRSFTTWAGWLLPYDRPFYVMVSGDSPAPLDETLHDLSLIGLDGTAGWFGADAIAAWGSAGRAYGRTATLTPEELAALRRRGEVTVLDVRGHSEWKAGHLPDVQNIPLGYLLDRLDEVPVDRPVALHCQGGTRSLIAASLLEARGITDVINLEGGFSAWEKAGLPVEH